MTGVQTCALPICVVQKCRNCKSDRFVLIMEPSVIQPNKYLWKMSYTYKCYHCDDSLTVAIGSEISYIELR